MIKLSDIAMELGLSTATVSNALTGKGRMKDETRQIIRQKALAMGYEPPQSSRNKKILIISESNRVSFCSDIACGASLSALQDNVACSICELAIGMQNLGRDATSKQLRPLVDNVLAHQDTMPDCVIYISQYPRSLPGLLKHIECPAVEVFCHNTGAQASVNYDDQQGAYQAVSHLIEIGRSRIAMISGPVDSQPVSERMIGYQRALIDHGLVFHPKLVWIGDWEIQSGRELTRNLLLSSERPDAIFTQNDTMACGALQAAQEMGLRVPEDVAIVGFDNVLFCTWTIPTLSSVQPPFVEMGTAAYTLASQLMAGKEPVPAQLKLPCTLIHRQSTRDTSEA